MRDLPTRFPKTVWNSRRKVLKSSLSYKVRILRARRKNASITCSFPISEP